MIASVVRLTDTTFDQNRAEMNGGAVAAKQDSIIKLVDGSNTFQSNSATNGGAIYLVSNSSYVTHSTGDSSRRRLATTAEDDRFARELQGEYSFNYTYEYVPGAPGQGDEFKFNNALRAGPALFWNPQATDGKGMLKRCVADFASGELSAVLTDNSAYYPSASGAATPPVSINATHNNAFEELTGGYTAADGGKGPLRAPIVVSATDYYGNLADLAATTDALVRLTTCEPVYTGTDDAAAVNNETAVDDAYAVSNADAVCTLTGNLDYYGPKTYPFIEFGFDIDDLNPNTSIPTHPDYDPWSTNTAGNKRTGVQITCVPGIPVDVDVEAEILTPENVYLTLTTSTHDSIAGSIPNVPRSGRTLEPVRRGRRLSAGGTVAARARTTSARSSA